LINQPSVEANPYLKMRGELQLRAKHAFERAAGWRFGLVFGALLILFAYAWDTAQLFVWHAEFWWVKLVLAFVTLLPLAILTGALGSYGNGFFKIVLWAIFGIVAGWGAIHIPFDGAHMALQNFDSTLRGVEFLPMPRAVSESYQRVALLGAGVGVLVGLAQTILINAAWERSTEDYQLTASGWAFLLLSAPLAFSFAFLFDNAAQLPLRTPIERINAIVQSGLNDAPDLDHTAMEGSRALPYLTGQQWRKQFSADYTLHLASADLTPAGNTYVDVSFANGFNWRCRLTSLGEFAVSCFALNTEYARYISEFVPRGSFRCNECQARVSQQAADWRAHHARPLTNTDHISVLHGAGSSIRVRVQSQRENSFECLIGGANPVIVEQCLNR